MAASELLDPPPGCQGLVITSLIAERERQDRRDHGQAADGVEALELADRVAGRRDELVEVARELVLVARPDDLVRLHEVGMRMSVEPARERLAFGDAAEGPKRGGRIRRQCGRRDACRERGLVVEALGQLRDLVHRAGYEEGIREREAREPHAWDVACLGEAPGRSAQPLDGLGLPAGRPVECALQIQRRGCLALRLRQRIEPALDGVGCAVKEGRPGGGDGVACLVPCLGRDPVLDRVLHSPGCRQRRGHPSVQVPYDFSVALELEPVEQELPHEWVVGEPAVGVVNGPWPQAGARGLLEEVTWQGQRVDAGLVELGGHARVDQRRAQLGLDRVEDLLAQEVEQRAARVRAREGGNARVARAEGDAERPALGGGEEPLGVHLGPAAQPKELAALLGAECELRRAELGEGPPAAELRDAQRQRRARGERHPQHRRACGEQIVDDRERRVAQMLGVVEDDHELLEQQPVQFGHELLADGTGIDTLLRHREPLGEQVDGSGRRLADRLHEPPQEPAGVGVGGRAAHPGRERMTAAERLFERCRLARSGAGDE